jgi:hypothetical protein
MIVTIPIKDLFDKPVWGNGDTVCITALGKRRGRSRKEEQLGEGVMREGEMLMGYAHAYDV